MPRTDKNKDSSDDSIWETGLNTEEKTGKLEQPLFPDITKQRTETSQKAGEVVYSNPDFDVPEAMTNLNALQLQMLENADPQVAERIRKVREQMVKNIGSAHNAMLKRFKVEQKAATADDRKRLSEDRREAVKEYIPVVRDGVIDAAKAVGKGAIALGKAAGWLFKKGIDVGRYAISNVVGLAADSVKEVSKASIDITKHRREQLGREEY